jgi:hypothetical protein
LLTTKILRQLHRCPARFKLYTVGNNNILISYDGKLPNAEKYKFMSTRESATHSNATEAASTKALCKDLVSKNVRIFKR